LYLPENNKLNISLTPVLQTQPFIDANEDNFHFSTEWQLADVHDFTRLIYQYRSNDSLTILSIPELLLGNHQSYFWRVRFFDNHNLSSSWSIPYSFATEESKFDLSPQNGVPDIQEITGTDTDLNHDNINDKDQINSYYKCLTLMNDNIQVGIEIEETNQAEIDYFSSLKNIHITDQLTDIHSFNESIGFKAFAQTAGFSITTTFYFSQQLNAKSIWHSYYQNQWNRFEEQVLIEKNNAIRIKIQDGSFGDFDGLENGIIIHCGCVGWSIQNTTKPDESGSGGCYISVISMKNLNEILLVYFVLISLCWLIWFRQTNIHIQGKKNA